MKRMVLLIIFFICTLTSLAHQPRIVENEKTQIKNPEISKAYYGTLKGNPHIFTFSSTTTFDLYVGILIPEIKNAQKNITALIYKNDTLLKEIGGKNADWKFFFEQFGQSRYLIDGEYKVAHEEAGTYKIIVTSFGNKGKYVLAIGEEESFNLGEILYDLRVIPKLKRDFFEESPISFIKSPFGLGYILITYVMAFTIGLLYRVLIKKFAKNFIRKRQKNIGKYDRLLRLGIGIALLLLAVTTTWGFWLIFFSGFSIFESSFSWSGFYAAIGKNTSS